jgi:hypothetical protein
MLIRQSCISSTPQAVPRFTTDPAAEFHLFREGGNVGSKDAGAGRGCRGQPAWFRCRVAASFWVYVLPATLLMARWPDLGDRVEHAVRAKQG